MNENKNKEKDLYINDNDQYPKFLTMVKHHFNSKIKNGSKIFTTDAAGLYETYINNILIEAQQHYSCSACKGFIEKFGNLATISIDGKIASIIWDENAVPEFFKKSVKAMKELVEKANVNGIFISDTHTLGRPVTNEWHHLSVDLPNELINHSRLQTAGQARAEKLEEYRMLSNALQEYSIGTVEKALTLLQSESLYRSERILGVAKWLKELHDTLNTLSHSTQKANIKWLAVGSAPAGFTHVKSSIIGTLLDDIVSGMAIESVARRFEEKMNPSNYMRSQAAPTQGSIEQAEKVIEKLGIANSLQRRYANYEEIYSFLWENRTIQNSSEQKSGVFGHLIPREKTTARKMDLPSTVMTWEKFQRTILPSAENIEALIDNPSRLMALVTASDDTSENILQWDNPFSWYYHGGIDGEIKRRVERAGGRYENNEIRCSLIWEGYTDLDLHCITPRAQHIYYGEKQDKIGGWLDIDMNGGSHRDSSPVENIRWIQNAPEGHYRFYVHNYCERGNGYTPYKVELEVNGKVYIYNGVAGADGYQADVFVFNYVKGQHPTIISHSYSSDDSWSVSANTFVKVNGITNSPNLWGENPVPQSGTHIFFLLDGVKDLSEGKGRGFFNETLKSELREIRRTLEAYTANTPIEEAEKATACGVGYSKDIEWNLTLKVTSNDTTRMIKIDRWD
ncbi:hypothetical protein [Cytobacillus massiliigabonensis]|uniref:hypothetical protein n=1 Tax=Cytobacillus massiliigabonensis TaxID=1871011 RepID=UPI000C832DD4|nr:hypothetical protein [Cytobacillus massiliigabonensis]